MLNWKGSFRYGAGVYKLALGLVAQGKIELKPLITHRYKFDQAKEAFQCMVDNKGYDGKPPIKCESFHCSTEDTFLSKGSYVCSLLLYYGMQLPLVL